MNDDLLIEIFARLPLKSLFRFKCVSKAWCRLISDDYLRRRLPLITSAIFYRCDDEPRYACSSSDRGGGGGSLDESSLSFFPFHKNSAIVDCCNGLVLCYSSLLSAFFVLNPSTKRWRSIPKPKKRSQRSILAFDPTHSSEFKVVSFAGWLAEGAELEVFASGTGNWVEHVVHWGLSSDALSTTMRFFDGVLYILAYPNYVVGVDFTGMTCRKMELPEPMELEARIGKCDGSLFYTHKDDGQLKIWMLRESNGSFNWILRDAISVKLMVERIPKTSSSSSPLFSQQIQFKFLAFHPQREVVYFWLPGKIVSYDLSKKLLEAAYEPGKEMEAAYFFQIWLFPFSCYMSDCLAKI